VPLKSPRPRGAAGRESTDSVSFEALLRALHPEREQAAQKYAEVRSRLEGFFTWRGARWPDELTDETIDRVARRVAGGEVIRAAEVGRYFLGVARNVLREAWQRERTRPEHALGSVEDRAVGPSARPPVDEEVRMRCLDQCLLELGLEGRQLLLRYYEGEGGVRIASRRALATEMSLAPATLRIRLHRLRARVEACVRRCLGREETSGPPAPLVGEDGRT
jgi:DNA-directed RNA polymerase specialized sigma24 family protein